MDRPLIISIVTPSYNQVEFIQDTLNSISKQVGDFYIDLIIVDGASTDGSLTIIKSYQEEVCKGEVIFENDGLSYYVNSVACKGISCRWVSERDSGQADAINKGFFMAKGDIHCWLNSDDIYASASTLNYIVNFFKTHNDQHFVYGKGYTLNRAGDVVGTEDYVVNSSKENINEIDFILQPAAFWTKSIYLEVGKLNEDYHYVLDWDYWIRISKKYKLNFIDEFLACNRIYPLTKTSSGASKRYVEILNFLSKNNSLTEKSLHAYVIGAEVDNLLKSLNIFLRYIVIFSMITKKESFGVAMSISFQKILKVLKISKDV